MQNAQQQARALTRAYDQHVHIFAVPGRPGIYTTHSKSQPRRRFNLVVEGDSVACSCPGFAYRGICKHAEALRNRLARESVESARRPRPRHTTAPLALSLPAPEFSAA